MLAPSPRDLSGKYTALRRFRLPLIIFLLMILIGVVISWSLQRFNRERIQLTTEVTAEQVVLRLESWIDTRVASLHRFVRDTPVDYTSNPEEFYSIAKTLVSTYQGFQAINWIDSTFTINLIFPEEGNERALGKDLLKHPEKSVQTAIQKALDTGQISRTDRILLLQGGYGFASYNPIHAQDGHLTGMVNGVFKIDDLVNSCLSEVGLREKYRFAFLDTTGFVVSNHSMPVTGERLQDEVSIPVQVVDVPWTFVMAPSDAYLARYNTTAIRWIQLISFLAGLTGAWLTWIISQNRRALHEQQERFLSLFTASHDAIYMTTREGKFIAANDALVSLFGYNQEELARLNALDIYMNPGDREKLVDALRQEKYVRDYEIQLRHRDGTPLDCLLTTSIKQGRDGQTLSYQGIIRDITQQKKATGALRASEENLSTILDSIGDAVIATDTRGLIVRMNPVACRLTGWSFEEAAGRKLTDVMKMYHSSTPTQIISPVEQILETGSVTTISTDTMLKDRSGKSHHIADSGAPIRGRDGRINGVVLVFRDITAEHQLQEQYRQAQKMEAIGRLAGGVAHDFNNLLTAISGNADLALMRLEQDGDVRQELEEVQKTSERAANLTRQLLSFSRNQVIKSRLLDVNTILVDMKQMLDRLIGEHIELAFEPGENLPLVMSDPAQIEQVIVNLVVNAADAMPEGGKISISTGRTHLKGDSIERIAGLEPGDYLILSVSDNGSGMSLDVQERIFEPFFTTKKGGKGTGLGLATVYGIVKQAKGDIQVNSQPGGGTTFTIFLPGKQADLVSEPDIPDETGSLEGTETLLVVEDEIAVSDLAIRTLNQFGYKVLSAGNGAEALELCQSCAKPVDLVISDVVMPRMGGVEFARVLATLWPGTPVLFISGYHEELNLDRNHLDKGYSYLPKPFRPVDLVQRVRAMLDDQG